MTHTYDIAKTDVLSTLLWSRIIIGFQEYLREVRELTEALTKEESVLINHDLANEPERSVSERTTTKKNTAAARSLDAGLFRFV